MPATCGLDIDVPAIAWNSSPGSAARIGERRCAGEDLHAGRGDVGLDDVGASRSGPREEKTVIDGADGRSDDLRRRVIAPWRCAGSRRCTP